MKKPSQETSTRSYDDAHDQLAKVWKKFMIRMDEQRSKLRAHADALRAQKSIEIH